MEMTLAMNSFELMTFEEMLLVDGGVNGDRVLAGAALYTGSTLAVCLVTGPIGWGAAVAYWGCCAVAGAYIGYGLAT